MRDEWYGDKRDVVKWAALVHLARAHKIGQIVQVAFYRPSDAVLRLGIDSEEVPIPEEVLHRFRDLDQIQTLGTATSLSIHVHKEPFEPDEGSLGTPAFRKRYIEQVVAVLSDFRDVRLIAFLDPDTGIAPDRATQKHVKPAEIRMVYDALKPDDMLVLYQHASRTRHWLGAKKRAFAEAVCVHENDVNTITCREVARDVAFFSVRKA